MAEKTYHIVKNDDGGWDVKKSGASRASRRAPTKAQAVETATSMLKNSGGGDFVIHAADGRVVERKKYVLTVNGGHLQLTPGTVQFVHRDAKGRIVPSDATPRRSTTVSGGSSIKSNPKSGRSRVTNKTATGSKKVSRTKTTK